MLLQQELQDKSNDRGCVHAGTKRKYVKRLKAVLKDKFPKHPDWSNQAEWWPQLLNNFNKEGKAQQNKVTFKWRQWLESSLLIQAQHTRQSTHGSWHGPLPKHGGGWSHIHLPRGSYDLCVFYLVHLWFFTHLCFVSLQLLKNAGWSDPNNMEQHCQLVTLYNGVGRLFRSSRLNGIRMERKSG